MLALLPKGNTSVSGIALLGGLLLWCGASIGEATRGDSS